jgi:hypothetical protein
MANGETVTAVAQAFFDSDEYHGRLVQGYYQEFLHRAPNANELAAMTAALDQLTTDESLIADFVASPEYLYRQ